MQQIDLKAVARKNRLLPLLLGRAATGGGKGEIVAKKEGVAQAIARHRFTFESADNRIL
ncbi:MAG: hypothetical protein HC934_06200 [Acaryochloridaceae cyanobacterium SU_2_1]|nr:hypothetical protein [Acaryochloridaceae cyanobacterium SU_2_1]